MALTHRDVQKIAELARLRVSGEEADRLLHDLNRILNCAEQLKEVDVEGVAETFHPMQQETPLREDEVQASLTQKEALGNAPDQKDGHFRVPRAIG